MNDFDEYIRQREPSEREKSQIWQTAIGLQQVDGLTPSAYLIETAKENIEGKITIDEVKYRIDNYYKDESGQKDELGGQKRWSNCSNSLPKSPILHEKNCLKH